MRSFFLKSQVALWSSLVPFLVSDLCYTQNIYSPFLAAATPSKQEETDEPKYTVNFNNTSVIEVIRFVSKITGANFVFSEQDLQFNVTIISEEPISSKNFTSALIQVLRVHGLTLLEQEGNFLITQSSSGVNQISTVVSGDIPDSIRTKAPIVTRVFRIKNASVSHIASLIKPMTSQTSQIEISEQTSQLIITDITTNVDKIALLLLSLDTPHSNLEIEAYTAKHVYPLDIITLTQQILAPFRDSNALLFIPQMDNNTIFVISTPHLIERSLSIMEDIDVPPAAVKIGAAPLPPAAQNVHIYKLLHQSSENILPALQNIEKQLPKGASSRLAQAMQSVKYIQNTGSLAFVTDIDTWNQIKEILAGIDLPPYFGQGGKPSFWVYKIQNGNVEHIKAALKQMHSSIQDKALQDTLSSVKWIKETDSLVFTGPETSIQEVQKLIPTLDISKEAIPVKLQLYVYKALRASEAQISASLQEIAKNFQDKDLSFAIENRKWVAESNSFLFNGSSEAIAKLHSILPTLDELTSTGPKLEFYLYKIQNSRVEQIESALKTILSTSKDPSIESLLKSMKWLEDSNTLLFNGTPEDIKTLHNLLPSLDVDSSKSLQLYTYNVQHTTGDHLLSTLKELAKTTQDKDLAAIILTVKWVQESNTLIFSGSKDACAKLQNILPSLDASKQGREIYSYKVQKTTAKEILHALEQITKASHDQALIDATRTVEWVQGSNTLVFNGTSATISKLQHILPSLDITEKAKEIYTYKIQSSSASKLLNSLKQIAKSSQDAELIELVQSAEWVQASNTLVFNGTSTTIVKLQHLLPSLDVIEKAKELYTYKIQSSSASKLLDSLKQIAKSSQDAELIELVQSAEWVQASNTLVFNGPSTTIVKLQHLLPSLDVTEKAKELYTYKIQSSSASKLTDSLKQIAKSSQDAELTELVQSAEWVQASNTLVFNGTAAALAKIKTILPTLDSGESSLETQFFLYKIQTATKEQITDSLNKMLGSIQDKDLISAIQSMKWIQDVNTLIFNGTSGAINSLKSILTSIDISPAFFKESQLYTYKIQFTPATQISLSLEQIAKVTQDKQLIEAVKTMKWIQDSNALIFNCPQDTIVKLQNILPTLDAAVPANSEMQFFLYKVQHLPADQVESSLKKVAGTIQDKDLAKMIQNMKWIQEANTLVFNGTKKSISELNKILLDIDVAPANVQEMQFYMYKIVNTSAAQIESSLKQMAQSIQDKDFIAAVNTMKWMQEINTLLFNGNETTITKLKNTLPTLDIAEAKVELYTYKIQAATGTHIISSLHDAVKNIEDKDLINAIQSVKWIQESNTLLFQATPGAITKLQSLLPSFDSSSFLSKNQFLIYSPKNQSGESLIKNLKELYQNFKASGLENGSFLAALDSMKWVSSSQSLVFSGDTASLDRIHAIVKDIDTVSGNSLGETFLYKPIYASQFQLQEALSRFAETLNLAVKEDDLLAQTIYKAEWIPQSSSFLFKAPPATLSKLKTVLASLDNPKGVTNSYGTTFFLYKLKSTPGNLVIQNLKDLSNNLPKEDPSNAAVVSSIQTLKWVKENNTILITGSGSTIEQVKSLIAEFDENVSNKIAPAESADFFIYKHLNQSPEALVKSLKDLAKDLSTSGLGDQDLIRTLEAVRVVASSNSLLFTGSSASIAKIKILLPSIDTLNPDAHSIQTIGTSVFFIYKIKNTSADELIRIVKNFASQLSNTSIEDKNLEKSLNSVQWVKETNSLLFTGPQATLQKLEALVTKFDLEAQAPAKAPRETPSTFEVYTPKNQTGSALIAILHEFMQNLTASGVSDSLLFDAINHLKFIDKTNSLIISGQHDAIQKVQELLVKFDIPTNTGEATIDSTELANFLIYKLQYHAGADLQAALKKVAYSLNKTAPEANKALIDVIDSLQWIEVTNSLLGTGTPEILVKLKELILSIDVPLRQVFIEVLVVETSLFNSQNFGLQWGSQLQYLNKTVGALGNFPVKVQNTVNGSNVNTGTVDLSTPISYATNLNTPVQGNALNSTTAVPFSTGFDLGVIGDILFHKGQSFISLGSLLNALQVDNDTTVVMNPKIITQDGHTSKIFVGQNIPFVGSFISNTASNTVQSSNIEYRDVGVDLTITPTLGTNNIITLDIKQDISEQTNNTTQVQGSQVTGIQTSHTTMNTRVHVPDRHFLVLSGMIQDTKVHFKSSIPCLGGLPVIGAIFGENSRIDTKSNVIIFLRPFIIDTVEDFAKLTNAEEDLYKQQAGPQDLKEELDAGFEMIKNLNND